MAYDKQLTYFVPLMVKGCNIVDSIHAEMLPSPFLSLVISGIVSNTAWMRRRRRALQFFRARLQIANVADSLAA